jgi:hypothetical protein
LETCEDKIILCERERYWIKTLNSQNPNIGYNIADGGTGGDTFSGLDDISKKALRLVRSINAVNQDNFKFNKNNLISNYGDELGESKYKSWKENVSRANKLKAAKKEDDLRALYINEILTLYKDFTIMEIYKKLDKKVPSRLISKFLKEVGVNLIARHNVNSGINNGMSKLSADDIHQIRSLKGYMSGKKISKMFNISATQACSILRNASYKNI